MTQAQCVRSDPGHEAAGCANHASNANYDTATAILNLAKLIAASASARRGTSETRADLSPATVQEAKWYDLRFCLPSGTRIYRDLRTGALVMLKKINGLYAPINL